MLVKENFEVQTTTKDAKDVDFTAIFQEGLPPDARELVEFKLSLDKDKATSKDDEIKQKVSNARNNLAVAKEIFHDDKAVSAKMMASELLYDQLNLNKY